MNFAIGVVSLSAKIAVSVLVGVAVSVAVRGTSNKIDRRVNGCIHAVSPKTRKIGR